MLYNISIKEFIMGKSRRRMTSQKFATKFAAKFAKFRAAVEEAISITAGTYEEVVEERKEVEEKKVPKVIIKEIDESVISEPKPKTQSARKPPRKKTPDSKKKPARKRTTLNVSEGFGLPVFRNSTAASPSISGSPLSSRTRRPVRPAISSNSRIR